MKPLNKNVIIKPDPVEEKFKGFIKPDSVTDERPETGIVLASASDEIPNGAHVLYNRSSARKLKEVIVLKEDDIFAII